MKTITFDNLVKMIEPGKKHPVLINTLSREDFEKKHIPGSISLPAEQIPQKANQLFSKHDWLVVYCANPQCTESQKAAESLEKLGFSNVYRFEDGVDGWQHHKLYTSTETGAAGQKSKTFKAA